MAKQTNSRPIIPLFNGMKIFGNPDSFRIYELLLNTPAKIDAFLGLTAGTTLYGADPSGGSLIPISGQWLDRSIPLVQAKLAAFQAQEGVVADFYQPVRDIYPADFALKKNCRFSYTDYTIGSVTQLGQSWFGLTYKLVLRQCGVP
jgi:hypothetical protein